jgi:hypothetical protein
MKKSDKMRKLLSKSTVKKNLAVEKKELVTNENFEDQLLKSVNEVSEYISKEKIIKKIVKKIIKKKY